MEGAEKWHLNDISKANPAHMTYPIGGATFANQHLSGGSYVEGRNFYRFVQLRSMADNHNTRRARQPLHCTKCHSGELATLQHILCKCDDNASSIRSRHDQVLQQIVYHCRKQNLVTIVEPSLPNGLRPDLLVLLPNREILCLDVTVIFELNKESLNKANHIKQSKYEPYVEELSNIMWHEMRLLAEHQPRLFEPAPPPLRPPRMSIYGLAFGCRGTISATALNILKDKLKMPNWKINKLLNLVISNSLDLFIHSPLATNSAT